MGDAVGCLDGEAVLHAGDDCHSVLRSLVDELCLGWLACLGDHHYVVEVGGSGPAEVYVGAVVGGRVEADGERGGGGGVDWVVGGGWVVSLWRLIRARVVMAAVATAMLAAASSQVRRRVGLAGVGVGGGACGGEGLEVEAATCAAGGTVLVVEGAVGAGAGTTRVAEAATGAGAAWAGAMLVAEAAMGAAAAGAVAGAGAGAGTGLGVAGGQERRRGRDIRAGRGRGRVASWLAATDWAVGVGWAA